MFIDPDKKIEKIKKQRPGLYQSTQHPEHFENEGEEYMQMKPNEEQNDQPLRVTKNTGKPTDQQ